MAILSPARTTPWRLRAPELVLPVLVPVVLLLTLEARYPRRLESASSLDQYFGGVYRTRILGRDLIEGIAHVLAVTTGAWGVRTGLLAGWLVVNGVSFLVLAALLYRATRTLRGGVVLYIGALAVVTCSALTITPYDCLSYMLIAATVLAAWSSFRGHVVAAGALAVAATCTRESALLAVAVLVAAAWPSRTAPLRALAQVLRDRAAVVVAAATVTTYVVLHLLLRTRHGPAFFQWQPFHWNMRGASLLAALIALALLVTVRAATRGVHPGPEFRLGRRRFWVLSTPYLVVCVLGGIWAEAPRLLMPVLLGEMLLAVRFATLEEAAAHLQPATREPAPRAERPVLVASSATSAMIGGALEEPGLSGRG